MPSHLKADAHLDLPDRTCSIMTCWQSDRTVALARERKVRTPQGSVPDNAREGGFKFTRRKVPQKTYRRAVAVTQPPIGLRSLGGSAVRVKRCGKSAPPRQ